MVAKRLMLPCLLSKIAANRMSLCYADGLVLNIATLSGPRRGAMQAFAAVTEGALTAMTRNQAQEWAPRGIRFNAIAPQVMGLTGDSINGEADIAALALYLASERGSEMSRQIFAADEMKFFDCPCRAGGRAAAVEWKRLDCDVRRSSARRRGGAASGSCRPAAPAASATAAMAVGSGRSNTNSP